MADAIVVTPGAATANGYCTVARARQVFANTPGGDPTVSRIVSSSVAAATVVTTDAAHGLTTGDLITIAGHTGSTPALDGTYAVTVTGTATFTIPLTVTVAGRGGTASADDTLTRALLTATQLVDDGFEFDGIPTTYTQALAWPRYGLLTKSNAALDPHTIPAALEQATAELARTLVKDALLLEQNNDLVGVTKIKAGRAFEIDFSAGANPTTRLIPDQVARLIARWGVRLGASSMTTLLRG